ncbi:hypothetical protein Tco_0080096 [Tanacetum coccineum]
MKNTLSMESYIEGANVNNSIDLLLIGNLLVMSNTNVESLLSRSFRLSNGMVTNIWIGSPFVEMMTSYIHSRKATSKGFAFKTSKRRTCKLSSCVQGNLVTYTNDVSVLPLNDRLKEIRMKYLPQTIWRQSDRDKAGAMIQAIDKQLKTRRIMRSLEKFIGGRPYEGGFLAALRGP